MELCQEEGKYPQSMQLPVAAVLDVLVEDVFQEKSMGDLLSPSLTESMGDLLSPSQTESMGDLFSFQTESVDVPDTAGSPDELLERRLLVLRGILDSEETYLSELGALLTPMKAIQASAGTSKPVLSSQEVQTIFYQVPELRDLHREFYSALKARLGPHAKLSSRGGSKSDQGPLVDSVPTQGSESDPETEVELEGNQRAFELTVGDLFLKMVSQLGVYRGFIDNYETAVEIVRKCTLAEPRFRTLAQSMMSTSDASKTKTTYTFETLLYKPLDRVTKTTLVLHDLLRTTPEEHRDHSVLQEALRLSQGFLVGVNETSRCKREVTLTHGMRRKLMRDGFVVDVCEGERHLRHLFLYTDLLLCVKPKAASKGKQAQYRFCWYMPMAGLRPCRAPRAERSTRAHQHVHAVRAKLFLLRHPQTPTGVSKGFVYRTQERGKKRQEQMELMLLTHSPVHQLELHSPSGKSHTVLLSSRYELEEWREAIDKLTRDDVETVPPDLLTLTSSCAKLRMTQQPPLQSLITGESGSLCGTLSVAVHSASGLTEPSCVYVCVEVDGYEFYELQAQTQSSVVSLSPHWDQEFSFEVDGTQNLRVICVSQSKHDGGEQDIVLGKTSMKLEPDALQNYWKEQSLFLGQVTLCLSLKYCPHPLDPPSPLPAQQQAVFSVPIGVVARQEGVQVPHVVRCLVEEVERRGLGEVGIYRVSGLASDICSLKAAFNASLRGAVVKVRCVEVHAVSCLLKLYFRELPEPLIPTELFQRLAQAVGITDVNTRNASMLSILRSCPHVNRNTFLYILQHLRRVAEREEVNKMSMLNLATVFGPSLLRPPVADLGQCSPSMVISQEVAVQVQVVFLFLQCPLLLEALIREQHHTASEKDSTAM